MKWVEKLILRSDLHVSISHHQPSVHTAVKGCPQWRWVFELQPRLPSLLCRGTQLVSGGRTSSPPESCCRDKRSVLCGFHKVSPELWQMTLTVRGTEQRPQGPDRTRESKVRGYPVTLNRASDEQSATTRLIPPEALAGWTINAVYFISLLPLFLYIFL